MPVIRSADDDGVNIVIANNITEVLMLADAALVVRAVQLGVKFGAQSFGIFFAFFHHITDGNHLHFR